MKSGVWIIPPCLFHMNYAQGSVLHRSAIWGKRATFVLGNEKIFTSGLNRRDFLQKSSDVICFDAVGGFGKFSWSFVNTISNQSHEKFIELNHFHSGWYFPKRFVYGDSIMHFIYGFGCMRVFFFSLLFWIFKIPQRLQCWMFFAKLKFTDLWESKRELCSGWSLTRYCNLPVGTF